MSKPEPIEEYPAFMYIEPAKDIPMYMFRGMVAAWAIDAGISYIDVPVVGIGCWIKVDSEEDAVIVRLRWH